MSDTQGKQVDTIGTTSTIGKEVGDNIAEIQTNITSKIKPGEAVDTEGNIQPQTINDGTEGQYETGMFSEIEVSKLASIPQQ